MNRFLKKSLLLLFSAGLLAFTSCAGNAPEELYKTAQFEELQKNEEHALQLYEEIINKHPESEYAQKAKDRVSELKK